MKLYPKNVCILGIASLCVTIIFAFHICHAEERAFQELQAESIDCTLYVRVAGNYESGSTLIAINGGPGLSSLYMLNLERLAGPELAVVTYDQRGLGRSTSVPPDIANFELIDYVVDLEAVRKAVGTERVHLLGHSWGGIVAMYYAIVYPERVRSMVLVGSGPPVWEGVLTCVSRIQTRFQELQETGVIPSDLTPGTAEYERAYLRAYFYDPTFWFSDDDEGGPPEFNQQVSELTWPTLEDMDLTSDVAELEHKVLLLWGDGDPCGISVGESIRDALSSADVQFVILKDCGHFWHECPKQFFSQVRTFLDLASEP